MRSPTRSSDLKLIRAYTKIKLETQRYLCTLNFVIRCSIIFWLQSTLVTSITLVTWIVRKNKTFELMKY